MKKTIVIYASNYGFTKQYALHISKKLECDACEVQHFDTKSLDNYNNIIFGSGVYAGKMNEASFINKNEEKLASKNVVIFSVSLTTPRNEEEKRRIQNVFDKSIKISQTPKFFSLPGGMNYSKLNTIHSMMMKAAKLSMKSKLTKEEYDDFDQDRNLVDLTQSNDLIEYVKSL
jgi:menaquinone-dependent protoporphyrinogen IX oxidase